MNNNTYTEVYKELDIILSKYVVPNNRYSITKEKIIHTIITYQHLKDMANYLNVSSAQYLTNFFTRYILDAPRGKHKLSYILNMLSYKRCSKCGEFKCKDEFYVDNSHYDKLDTFCKSCDNSAKINYYNSNRSYFFAKDAKRRAAKLDRLASWANLSKIEEIYKNCPEGYHVDHIIPLQGKLVSGLHVETNLQYLPAEDNLRKGNRFDVS